MDKEESMKKREEELYADCTEEERELFRWVREEQEALEAMGLGGGLEGLMERLDSGKSEIIGFEIEEMDECSLGE